MHLAGDRHAVLRLRVVDGVPADDHEPGAVGDVLAAGQQLAQQFGGELVGVPADEVEREEWSPAHCVHVGDAVGGRHLAPGARVVDHRGDEVGGRHDGAVVVEAPDGGVVAGVRPDEEFGGVRCVEVAHDVRQFARGELAASTGAVAELGQSDLLAVVLRRVVIVHRHLLSGEGRLSAVARSSLTSRSTISSLAMSSSASWSASTSVPAGSRSSAVASNRASADIGADPVEVWSSSMLTSRRARAVETSCDDPGPILADQMQRHGQCVVGGFVRRGDRHSDIEQTLGVQCFERIGQLGDPVIRRGDDHDSGELAGEAGHVAAIPVAAVSGDRTGEGAHESGSIVADDRQYECRHDSESRTIEARCDTRRVRSPVGRGSRR